MIPGSANPLLLKSAAAAAGGYQIERSLRFNSSDSAYLSRTPASAGNRKTWTWAGWVKASRLGTYRGILEGYTGSPAFANRTSLQLANADQIDVLFDNSSSGRITTTQVFRDVSACYHIVFACDTTQATASNRFKIYINDSQITTFATATYPSQNYDTGINTTQSHYMARVVDPLYADFYLADVHFIDGQALTPSSFTEVSATTGQLIPKAYTGSFGTNGFWLKFSDNSAATATTLGKDYSGNSNNWTPNNLSVTAGAGNDSLVDTPTSYGTDDSLGGSVRGNYCTLNPLNNGGITLSNGNLDWAGNGAGTKVSYGTVAVSSGKWYFEASINGATGGVNWECGIARVGTANNSRPGATANGWQVDSSGSTTLNKRNNNSATSIYSSGLSNGDILGVAFDVDNGRIWFARNGTWLEGSPSAGTGASFTNVSGTVAPFGGSDGSGPNSAMNFGQRPFAYTAPSGFKALCDTNLPAPVVAKPSTVMDVVLRTGTGTSGGTISSLNFSADFIWSKLRSTSSSHYLLDSVRGIANTLQSNSTASEASYPTWFTSITSTGYTVGSGDWTSGASVVEWCWDAGSSTVTNTQGSITSQVRANVSAGFSVVTYTANGTNGTSVGHGLNVKPALVIQKDRTSASDWLVLTQLIDGSNDYLLLNSTAAAANAAAGMTSTTFGSWDRTNGNNMVAYCFAPVVGYSSFGSYTGNGSTDGPFVYTGFRPRWIMVKSTGSGAWIMHDTSRNPYNASVMELQANDATSEYNTNTFSAGDRFDILSNGFKSRTSNSYNNSSGQSYLYIAFAENPFQYARAR